MSGVVSRRTSAGVEVVEHRALATLVRAVVEIGIAPDGLPWLCEIDRSQRADTLQGVIAGLVQAFEASGVADLPDAVRCMVEDTLTPALMGIHDVELSPDTTSQGYVSRRTARALFGPPLLEQLLAPAPVTPGYPGPYPGIRTGTSQRRPAATIVTYASAAPSEPAAAPPTLADDALERAIAAAQTERHLLLTLDSQTWTTAIAGRGGTLRTPMKPFRPAVFESLAALDGAVAQVTVGYVTSQAPLADSAAYSTLLDHASEESGGTVSFQLPRATVLDVLIDVAELAGELHSRDVVHGDITPANVLLDGAKATAPDGLFLGSGEVATAATFEWAAPEQVTGRPVDPRTDVFTIGKMLAAVVGAVPFGEKVEYVVPTGGTDSRTVTLMKTEGVFIDRTELGVERDWQNTWQTALAAILAYDPDRRPANGAALAEVLRELRTSHSPPGLLPIAGAFGAVTAVGSGDQRRYARIVADW
jgi:Protein kinase domain